MTRIRSSVAVLLALLWVPLTAHCRIESLPGMALLSCCQHEETAPHPDDDCETDGCAVVETGFYKIDDDQPVVSPPPVVVFDSLPPVSIKLPDPPSPRLQSSDVLLALPAIWQFTHRAAAPPRAPSLVS